MDDASDLLAEIESMNERRFEEIENSKKKEKKSKRKRKNEREPSDKSKIKVLKSQSYDGHVYREFDKDVKNKVIIGFADFESISLNQTNYEWEGKKLKGLNLQINRSYGKDEDNKKTFSFRITKKKMKSFFEAVEMAKSIFENSNNQFN